MYYIVFFILLFFLIKEIYFGQKVSKKKFDILFLTLTLMSCFRYGQGTDYFSYMFLYQNNAYYDYNYVLSNADFGFYTLYYLGKLFDIPFELLASLISLLTLAMFYHFFKRDCNYSIFSLFIFYCVVWMIYINSALRQGLAMAFFVYFALPNLYSNNYMKYITFVIISSLFHASAISLLFLPIFYNIKSNKLRLYIIIISLVLMFFGSRFLLLMNIGFIMNRISYYLNGESETFFLARIVRILYTIPIIILLLNTKSDYVKRYCNMYIYGLLLYSILSFADALSTRFWGYVLIFLLLIAQTINVDNVLQKLHKQVIEFCLCVLVSLLMFKNFGAFIEQANYDKEVTMFSFPYISIFNKSDANVINSKFSPVD